MTVTLLVVAIIAIPVGVISAVKQYSIFDIVVTTLSFIGQAIPEFWLGLILILVFYVWLKNPVTGDSPTTWWYVYIGCFLLTHRLDQASHIACHNGSGRLGYLVLALFTFQYAGCHPSRLCSNGTCKRINPEQSLLQTCVAQCTPAIGNNICFGSTLHICRIFVCRDPILLAWNGSFILPGSNRSRLPDAYGNPDNWNPCGHLCEFNS